MTSSEIGYKLVTFCLNWVVRGDDRIGGLVDGSNLSEHLYLSFKNIFNYF
jgi:hypothetical protein